MRFKDFLRGYGSIFTLFPTDDDKEVAKLKAPILSDEEALSKDWEIVGNDLYNAMETFLNEQQSYNARDSKNHHD
ncbi:MAG TPA: hypothetical protein VGV92_01230 [Gammaproteobacteria bacterium]|nr:hypothetical protein [Gammaproteobacteria bacterium]